MKTFALSRFAAACVLFAAALFGSAYARADMLVQKNVQVKLQQNVPLQESLTLASSGVLSVSVSDLVFPQALKSLSFAISDHDSVLAQYTGSGSLFYNIVNPGTYFANVYATPTQFSGVGLYHLNISFMPTVVPLPAAAWLLVSGIFLVVHLLRKKSSAARSKSARSFAPAANPALPIGRRRKAKGRMTAESAMVRGSSARNRAQKRPQTNSTGFMHTFVTKSIVQ